MKKNTKTFLMYLVGLVLLKEFIYPLEPSSTVTDTIATAITSLFFILQMLILSRVKLSKSTLTFNKQRFLMYSFVLGFFAGYHKKYGTTKLNNSPEAQPTDSVTFGVFTAIFYVLIAFTLCQIK